jgi:hypothetical protein
MVRRRRFPVLNIFMVVGMLGIAGFLCIMSFLIFWIFQPVRAANPFQTSGVTVIPAPTLTPTPDSFVTATPTIPPDQNGISIGAYVQISGTDGSGLRIRTGAGTENPVRFIGMDAEVFKVVDGPLKTDDYTWWMLQAPYDQTRSGWAASQYLSVVEKVP